MGLENMNISTIKLALFSLIILLLGGCASYSISEQEMTDYLTDKVHINQSVGIQELLYAHVAVDDIEIQIGRADEKRISVLANTTAQIQMMNTPEQALDLNLEFSAVPTYDKESGEIFLTALRLEHFEEKQQQLPVEFVQLLKPAVSMIGYALSQQPVYQLDSNKIEEALLKSAEPNLVIKDHKLVIELL